MREIKFRANRFGIIGKVLEINFSTSEKGFDFLLEDKNGNTIREWGKNLDLMQFTGLHDKHGKEIYEGDIVKSPDTLANDQYISQVVWESLRAGFYLPSMGGSGLANISIHGFQSDELEVIGNVYENPELLEDK